MVNNFFFRKMIDSEIKHITIINTLYTSSFIKYEIKKRCLIMLVMLVRMENLLSYLYKELTVHVQEQKRFKKA